VSTFRAVIQATRGPFLLLTPVCIFLGASTVVAAGGLIDPYHLLLALAGGLLAHISVNTLNEYDDFRSGLDMATARTPFSGGSGALPARPQALNAVFATGVFSLTACLLIGVYFAWLLGFEIVPLGLLGAVLIVTYTEWINRSALLCLVAPGLGFGLLMVAGTAFVLSGHYSQLPWIAGLVPFFLVSNLLLLNQYPDIDADRAAGRRHLPITVGTARSSLVYGLFALAAALTIVYGIVAQHFPLLSLIALLPFPLAVFAMRGALRHGGEIGLHPRYLGANVALTLLAPALLGIALIFG
jgi:1,4-dihydroxy-2-naphthoate octaprenyltransferase